MSLDGFYLAYMSSVGYGLVLFVIKEGNIVGADPGGVKFDGIYRELENSGNYSGKIKISAPPNIQLVQGVDSGETGLEYEVNFTIPSNFQDSPFFKVDTPFGAVNIKLEKIRNLGSVQ